MTRPLDTTMWTQKDIQAQINENVALRKQVTALEAALAEANKMLTAAHEQARKDSRELLELRTLAAEAQRQPQWQPVADDVLNYADIWIEGAWHTDWKICRKVEQQSTIDARLLRSVRTG